MMKKLFLNVAIVSALLAGSMSLVSCGDDDDEQENSTPLKTNEEQKQTLVDVSQQLSDELSKDSFKTSIDFLYSASDIEDADFDAILDVLEEAEYYDEDNDIEVLDLSKLTGEFVYNKKTNSFVLKDKSANFSIEFDDNGGRTCVLLLTGISDNVKSVKYDDDGDDYLVKYPENMVFTAKYDGDEFAKLTTKVSAKANDEYLGLKSALDFSSTLQVEDVVITLDKAKFENNKTSEVSLVAKKGKENLIKLSVSGVPNIVDDGGYEVDNLKNYKIECSVLDEITIKSTIADLNKLSDLINEADETAWDATENGDTDGSEVKKAVDKLNSECKVQIFYAGNSSAQAWLAFEPYYEYEEWYIEPVIKFNDGSMYSFDDDDFEDDPILGDIITILEDFIDAFEDELDDLD